MNHQYQKRNDRFNNHAHTTNNHPYNGQQTYPYAYLGPPNQTGYINNPNPQYYPPQNYHHQPNYNYQYQQQQQAYYMSNYNQPQNTPNYAPNSPGDSPDNQPTSPNYRPNNSRFFNQVKFEEKSEIFIYNHYNCEILFVLFLK